MHPFRKLILISLGRADSFEKTPSHGDWHLVFKMARQQTLLGVLFDAVQRLPQDQRPPESIYGEWQELTDKIAGIHQRHEARVRELEAILGRLGLHGCILKGTALSHLYPIPERRMCGDIDVWLKGTHDEILDTLEKYGPSKGAFLKNTSGVKKGFDGAVSRLQMLTFMIPRDFVYDLDHFGRPYGWGKALYDTPERHLGNEIVGASSGFSPRESLERMVRWLHGWMPDVGEETLRKALK